MNVTTGGRLSAIGFVLGLWLVAAPFVFGAAWAMRWSSVLTGAAVAALAAYNYRTVARRGSRPAWSSRLVAVRGLWAVAAPFVFGAGFGMLTSSVVAGAVVAGSGGYAGNLGRRLPGRA